MDLLKLEIIGGIPKSYFGPLKRVDIDSALESLLSGFESHIADATIHFTQSQINYNNLLNLPTLITSHLALTDIGTNTHDAIDSHISNAIIHRSINDSSTLTTVLWSGNKINSELAGKANSSHNHDAVHITSGTLVTARGGTNQTSWTANRLVFANSTTQLNSHTAITANRALISNASGLPTHSATTSTELGYVSGVTSAIQTQINSKINNAINIYGTISSANLATSWFVCNHGGTVYKLSGADLGGVPTLTANRNVVTDVSGNLTTLDLLYDLTNFGSHQQNLAYLDIFSGGVPTLKVLTQMTANRALLSDGSGLPIASSITNVELGYLTGVSSNIQTQLNAKASAVDVTGLSDFLTDHVQDADTAYTGNPNNQHVRVAGTGQRGAFLFIGNTTSGTIDILSYSNSVVQTDSPLNTVSLTIDDVVNHISTPQTIGSRKLHLPEINSGTLDKVLSNDGTYPVWVTASGGGLDFFEEIRYTASPNDVRPVHQLRAINPAGASLDIALTPKIEGAITRRVADATASGGNKRGHYAIDLSYSSQQADQVASGVSSTILNGANNKASGEKSAVLGGSDNSAIATYSSIVNGGVNSAEGDYSTVLNGFQAKAKGKNSVAYGKQAVAKEAGTTAVGYGAWYGNHNMISQKQSVMMVAYATAASTPVPFYLDGNTANTILNIGPDNGFLTGLIKLQMFVRNTAIATQLFQFRLRRSGSTRVFGVSAISTIDREGTPSINVPTITANLSIGQQWEFQLLIQSNTTGTIQYVADIEIIHTASGSTAWGYWY